MTAKVLNQPASLQDTGNGRNGRASGTQHLAKKLLSQFEGVGLHSILNHQKPTGQSFLRFMKAMAGGNLFKA
jgi:hypothetical protein